MFVVVVVVGGVAVAVQLVCCSKERFRKDDPRRVRYCSAMSCEKKEREQRWWLKKNWN